MANCSSYNCLALGEYETTFDNCATYRAGGIPSIILLACDHQITDPQSLAQVEAEIAAGRAWRVENIKGGLTPQTPETVAPVTSCGTERVVNNVYQLSIFDSKVSQLNAEFWGTLSAGYVLGGMIMGICSTSGLTDLMIYADAEVSVQGGVVSPDTNADVLRFEMTATFKLQQVEVLDDDEGVFA